MFYRQNGAAIIEQAHSLFDQTHIAAVFRTTSACMQTNFADEISPSQLSANRFSRFCHVASNCGSDRTATIRAESEEVQSGVGRAANFTPGTAPFARGELARPGAQEVRRGLRRTHESDWSLHGSHERARPV